MGLRWPFVKKLAALFALIALMSQLFLAGPIRRTSAHFAQPILTPRSVRPEPFVVGGTATLISITMAGYMTVFGSILAGAGIGKSPEGIAVPEPPTFTASVISGFGSILAFASPTAKAAEPLMTAPAGTVSYDFDDDNKADIGRWHSANTEFKVKNSSGGSYTTTTIGSSSAKPAPGDFDGDNKFDAAVFNAGTWTIKKSSDNSTVTVSWGASGDIPVTGDYDGDGKSDQAVFRPSTNTWWVLQSSNGSYTSTSYGSSGDIVVPGDYDGDSKTDFAVFRPSNGYWYLNQSANGSSTFPWGVATDIPVPADFDGDGKTDPAVYRPSSGTWYALKSSTGHSTYSTQNWGNYGDQPAPADYDGDGKADHCIWRPTTGVWYIKNSRHATDSNYPEFTYETLGVAGDRAIPSAYIKQIGGQVQGYGLTKLRLSPKNATGGTDLYSQNFAWGTSLVGLPGRSGLNAGFGIGYNSLVWVKDTANNAMIFDSDMSNVSPGFRFGFPVIEPAYLNTDTGAWAHLMVTPSGGRIEFRQTTASSTYETADSSYIQLKTKGAENPNDPVEDISISVTSTDGTLMNYEWIGGAYRCTQIKDRNGNYISITNDDQGLLKKVTDTLGREINVSYDAELYPTTITQSWKDDNGHGASSLHTWATFSYTSTNNPTINVNFGGMTVAGPPNGAALKVLEMITYADSSYTLFTYNSYGQVTKVANHAPNWDGLNYVRTNLGSLSGVQTDCPRLTQTISKIKNFNGEAEIFVDNTLLTGHQVTNIDGASVTASLIQVSMQNHPNGNVTNTYVGESGWMEALPIRTDDYANGNGLELKRSSWTKWTQDNTNLAYIQNPRVIESKVGDGTNLKRTTVEYLMQPGSGTVTQYGLVSAANVYDTDQTTVLKRSEVDYNLAAEYTSRRIIGLPSESRLYDENSALMSKVTNSYDENGYAGTGQSVSPIQHDDTNYGTGFAYRGNQTSATRYDVTGSTSNVTSSVKYNTAGSPISQTDPLGRVVTISYVDVWNDGVGRSTYAYPTTLTDPANNSSTVKYRYDIGANVRAQSPAPAGNTQGKITTREFDALGRASKETLVNTGAYTRHEYPTNGVQTKVYTTVTDTNNNNSGDASDEVLSESWSDGAGRVRQSRTPHTFDSNGSTATWAGTLVEYDILGQVKRQSVPTEINSSWNPAGDDNRGNDSYGNPIWLWNSQEYDWKGRVTRTIPSDSTGSDGKDSLVSYEGCGCAGGQVTTVKGPVTTAVDVAGNTQTTKRRTQKAYEDILGRTFKTEVWDLDGGGTYAPYSAVKTWFNGRDQATLVRQYSGGDSSGTFQDTTATFDGHGRIKTSHKPEQDSSKSTSYNYNADDSISDVTDARGAVTNYTYGSSYAAERRALLMGITYTVPSGSGITDPPDVTFNYDNVGNRTQMNDALGTVDYGYDELSRMTSESRAYNTTDTGFPNNAVTLTYSYTLGGQLKSYATPFSANLQVSQVNYGFDKTGRLSSVTGTSGGVNTTFASNPHYRAWGALSHLDYGNGTEMNAGGFNNKLQATTFEVKKGTTNIINKSYEFNTDGSVKKETDSVDARFDRSYEYDFVSRMTKALTGAEARGGTGSYSNIPYHNTYGYDAFNHRTNLNIANFTAPNGTPMTMTYTNNRITSGYASYDSDGNPTMVPGDGKTFSYNAAGQMHHTYIFLCCDGANYAQQTEDVIYDGEGNIGKVVTADWHNEDTPGSETTYKVHSTPLGGQVIYEGAVGSVFAGGTRIWAGGYWTHQDANGHTIRSTFSNGNVVGDGSLPDAYWDKKELDPDGKQTGFSAPVYYPLDDNDLFAPMMSDFFGSRMVNGQYTSYRVDGINVPADFFVMRLGLGRDPANLAMDLLFFSAMQSQRIRNWRFVGLDGYDATYGVGNVPQYAVDLLNRGLANAYAITDNSWSAINLISVQTQRQRRDDKKPSDLAPKGTASKTKLTAEECDKKLARLFGGPNAVVASTHDPLTLGFFDKTKEAFKGNLPPYITGERYIGHGPAPYPQGEGTEKGGIIHIYADARGLTVGPLYAPAGGSVSRNSIDGNGNQFRRVTYGTGLTITFTHTAPSKERGSNEMGSIRIGDIGGAGGSPEDSPLYVHSHLVFFSNFAKRTRVDPRKIFCGW